MQSRANRLFGSRWSAPSIAAALVCSWRPPAPGAQKVYLSE